MRPFLFLTFLGLAACTHACTQKSVANTPRDEARAGSQPSDTSGVPPAVLSAQGYLGCTISSRANGHQRLDIRSGQGLEFDVTVSPIIDGVVETKGADAGGSYRFTSHLVGQGKGKLSGVGDVTIESLDTRVAVEMKRYSQPGGRGTELSFTQGDMVNNGITYVEFTGHAKAANGDMYAFRVTLGAPGPGSGGKVTPASDADRAPIMRKAVVIEAPQTTVVTTTLEKSP